VLSLLYFACVAAVLIPAPLLEFRYFIIPFQIFLISAHARARQLDEGRRVRLVVWSLNLVLFLFVNVTTLYIFLYKPFKSPSGEVARFMW
jgi:alpha-1,2-glucosyltransferase